MAVDATTDTRIDAVEDTADVVTTVDIALEEADTILTLTAVIDVSIVMTTEAVELTAMLVDVRTDTGVRIDMNVVEMTDVEEDIKTGMTGVEGTVAVLPVAATTQHHPETLASHILVVAVDLTTILLSNVMVIGKWTSPVYSIVSRLLLA